MNHREMQVLQDRILMALVDFYYKDGYKSDTYNDEHRGGLYENKLADKMGFTVTPENLPPPDFLTACQQLRDRGYVRRCIRNDQNPRLLGIWPLPSGLDRVDYFKKPRWKRLLIDNTRDVRTIVVSAIVALITALITYLISALLS